MIQGANDRDPGPFVEVFLGYFGQLLKANNLDPSGLLFGGMKCKRAREKEATGFPSLL
jgi:hypothetical protein